MTHPFLPLAAALSLLAACSDEAPRATAATPAARGDYVARVRALPEGQRNGVLFRAIRDAGRDCQGVTESATAGEADGPAAWLATCEGGGQWLVALADDGTATITDARAAAAAAR